MVTMSDIDPQRDAEQAERDAECDCPECQEEEKRLAQNHDSDRTTD